MNPPAPPIHGTRRPDRNLLWSSLLSSFAYGPFFPFAMIRAFLRWRTLVYRFDREGVHMAWGILFRREVTLAYSRIQDLHLTSNIVERYFGLARILIQTAAGSANAEMTIEGLTDFEAVRDFLASRMRGAKDALHGETAAGEAIGLDPLHEVAARLAETAAELRALRLALGQGRAGDDRGQP